MHSSDWISKRETDAAVQGILQLARTYRQMNAAGGGLNEPPSFVGSGGAGVRPPPRRPYGAMLSIEHHLNDSDGGYGFASNPFPGYHVPFATPSSPPPPSRATATPTSSFVSPAPIKDGQHHVASSRGGGSREFTASVGRMTSTAKEQRHDLSWMKDGSASHQQPADGAALFMPDEFLRFHRVRARVDSEASLSAPSPLAQAAQQLWSSHQLGVSNAHTQSSGGSTHQRGGDTAAAATAGVFSPSPLRQSTFTMAHGDQEDPELGVLGPCDRVTPAHMVTFLKQLNCSTQDCVTANDFAVRLGQALSRQFDLAAELSTAAASGAYRHGAKNRPSSTMRRFFREEAHRDGCAGCGNSRTTGGMAGASAADTTAVDNGSSITTLKRQVRQLEGALQDQRLATQQAQRIVAALGGVRSHVSKTRAAFQNLKNDLKYWTKDLLEFGQTSASEAEGLLKSLLPTKPTSGSFVATAPSDSNNHNNPTQLLRSAIGAVHQSLCQSSDALRLEPLSTVEDAIEREELADLLLAAQKKASTGNGMADTGADIGSNTKLSSLLRCPQMHAPLRDDRRAPHPSDNFPSTWSSLFAYSGSEFNSVRMALTAGNFCLRMCEAFEGQRVEYAMLLRQLRQLQLQQNSVVSANVAAPSNSGGLLLIPPGTSGGTSVPSKSTGASVAASGPTKATSLGTAAESPKKPPPGSRGKVAAAADGSGDLPNGKGAKQPTKKPTAVASGAAAPRQKSNAIIEQKIEAGRDDEHDMKTHVDIAAQEPPTSPGDASEGEKEEATRKNPPALTEGMASAASYLIGHHDDDDADEVPSQKKKDTSADDDGDSSSSGPQRTSAGFTYDGRDADDFAGRQEGPADSSSPPGGVIRRPPRVAPRASGPRADRHTVAADAAGEDEVVAAAVDAIIPRAKSPAHTTPRSSAPVQDRPSPAAQLFVATPTKPLVSEAEGRGWSAAQPPQLNGRRLTSSQDVNEGPSSGPREVDGTPGMDTSNHHVPSQTAKFIAVADTSSTPPIAAAGGPLIAMSSASTVDHDDTTNRLPANHRTNHKVNDSRSVQPVAKAAVLVGSGGGPGTSAASVKQKAATGSGSDERLPASANKAPTPMAKAATGGVTAPSTGGWKPTATTTTTAAAPPHPTVPARVGTGGNQPQQARPGMAAGGPTAAGREGVRGTPPSGVNDRRPSGASDVPAARDDDGGVSDTAEGFTPPPVEPSASLPLRKMFDMKQRLLQATPMKGGGGGVAATAKGGAAGDTATAGRLLPTTLAGVKSSTSSGSQRNGAAASGDLKRRAADMISASNLTALSKALQGRLLTLKTYDPHPQLLFDDDCTVPTFSTTTRAT